MVDRSDWKAGKSAVPVGTWIPDLVRMLTRFGGSVPPPGMGTAATRANGVTTSARPFLTGRILSKKPMQFEGIRVRTAQCLIRLGCGRKLDAERSEIRNNGVLCIRATNFSG